MTPLVDPALMASLFRAASSRKLSEAAHGTAEAAIKRRVSDCLAAIASDIEQELGVRPAEISATTNEVAKKNTTPALSGDFCRDCGSASMLRTGTCMTCQSCGSTSGCA